MNNGMIEIGGEKWSEWRDSNCPPLVPNHRAGVQKPSISHCDRQWRHRFHDGHTKNAVMLPLDELSDSARTRN